MIQVENVLLSEDLFTAHFVCDLSACKGACCIEGDAGAPLAMEEIDFIEESLEAILPFLTPEGKKSIHELGVFTVDTDGDYVTTLNNGKECAFTTYDGNGTAKCGIEDAFRAGKTNFKKPTSCHLFPIRVQKLHEMEALNYEQIDICKPACECGSKLQVKVYQFLKEPLINKYGEEWYAHLQEVDKLLSKS
ncbi:DUF3109 family protein [Vicingaceae bacterium]|nr:DUF3109 family protein [Vicingaceae bacterium]MDC1450956.1 DUF3109 family protein [Vicingaceae bacterium]